MLIDWTTVSFQVVNFLLLIVLLKRYLYGPILRAMQRREEELSAIRKEAEDKRTSKSGKKRPPRA
jgi:F-type H+-transporting ATPase subunit b